jgi:hypothetical protein
MMAGSKPPSSPRTAFVDIDAVVLDRNDRAAMGSNGKAF